MNLIVRRIAAAKFIALLFVTIMSLYLLIYMETVSLMRLLMANVFICVFIFNFALNFFFSHQVKSAHQSYQFIYSILCNYKKSLNLRLKQSNFLERLSGPSIGLYFYDIAPCNIQTFCKVMYLSI